MPRKRLYLFDATLRDGARGQRNTVLVAGEWLANTMMSKWLAGKGSAES